MKEEKNYGTISDWQDSNRFRIPIDSDDYFLWTRGNVREYTLRFTTTLTEIIYNWLVARSKKNSDTIHEFSSEEQDLDHETIMWTSSVLSDFDGYEFYKKSILTSLKRTQIRPQELILTLVTRHIGFRNIWILTWWSCVEVLILIMKD